MASAERIYRVIFHNQGKIYEVYARSISDGGILGFVEIEELTFGERTQVVGDPAEVESACTVTPYRGFESLPLRQIQKWPQRGLFCI